MAEPDRECVPAAARVRCASGTSSNRPERPTARDPAPLDPAPPAPPRFPGATIELDAWGQISAVWLGATAPVLRDSRDVFEALDVDGNSGDASVIQLLLASAIGAPGDAWSVLATGVPVALHPRSGPPLSVAWDAVVRDGVIAAVALFALPGAVLHTEPDDPAETNRICVEALGLIDDCDACLLHLGQEPAARPVAHRLYRAMHTLKGSMRGPRLHAVRGLAHEIESAIQSLHEFDEAPGHVLADIAASLREIRAAVTAARPRGAIDDAMTCLLHECRPALVDLQLSTARLAAGDRAAASLARGAIDRIRLASQRGKLRALAAQCESSLRAVEALAITPAARAAAIDGIARLDQQLELYAAVHREALAGEAGAALLTAMSAELGSGDRGQRLDLVARAGIPSLAQALAASDPVIADAAAGLLVDAAAMFEPSAPRDETAQRFERAQCELGEAIKGLRGRVATAELVPLRTAVERLSLVPLAGLTRRLGYMTQSLARELGKRCEAKIDLGDIDVPPELSRVIGEMLLHAIRNALDHGIEPVEARDIAGKPQSATIEIVAYAMGSKLILTVRDDGRGVDIEDVRRRATERGLLPARTCSAADAAGLLELLFHPGFSTASNVTLVSGRGIGMHAIRSLATERGGTAGISSIRGQGTELTIELPLG